MEEIIRELHREVVRELGQSKAAKDPLGESGHQLKIQLENILKEITTDKNYNPFEITNRVLMELDRHMRFRH